MPPAVVGNAMIPVTFVGAAAVLMLVGMTASYLPARRSSRLEPMRALRQL